MKVADLLRPQDVEIDLAAPDKPRLMKSLAQMAAAATGLDKARVHDALQAREEFGSTGIGNGIALPHASVAGLKAPFGLFLRLVDPVDFDSIDEIRVDVVFLLLLPTGNRSADLNALSCIARQLRSQSVQTALRAASSRSELYTALTVMEP